MDFGQMIDELKQKITSLADAYKKTRTDKVNQFQQQRQQQTAQPQQTATTSANVLSGSVGEGGTNHEADVKKVQNLLNRHGIRPAVAEDGKIGPKTIEAIRKFQEIKLGTADGLVEPGKNTWKALLGNQIAPANNQNANENPNTNQNTGNNQAPAGQTSALLNSVQVTGAGSHTARQDNLQGKGLTGVQISQTMAKTDAQRVGTYKDLFVKVGKEQGVPPAILAAIASRETRGREIVGDHGNGFGIIQVDKRYHPEKVAKITAKQGRDRVEESIRQGAIVFKNSLAEIKKKFPQWTEAQHLKGALAAYNAGVSTVQTWEGMDKGTTGDDYSSDVWARAQFFAKEGGFTEGEEQAQQPNNNQQQPNNQQQQGQNQQQQPANNGGSANTLSGSVGDGGANNEADVKKVQNLLNRHGIKPQLPEDGKISANLIAAIRKFQEVKLGSADGLIEPGKNTWKALLGQNVPRVENNQSQNTNTNTGGAGGKIAHPNPGARMTSPYGMRIHPVTGVKKMHRGMDLAKGLGSPIYAAADGVVSHLNDPGGYGNWILLDHGNGYSTRYAHLSGYSTPNGARVTKGQQIGKEGNTGIGTGSHLHFEVRINGKDVDPAPYVAGSKTIP